MATRSGKGYTPAEMETPDGLLTEDTIAGHVKEIGEKFEIEEALCFQGKATSNTLDCTVNLFISPNLPSEQLPEVLRFPGRATSNTLDCTVHIFLSPSLPPNLTPHVVQNFLGVQIQASSSLQLDLESIQSAVSEAINGDSRITKNWTVAVTLRQMQLSPQSLAILQISTNQPKDTQSESAVKTATEFLETNFPSGPNFTAVVKVPLGRQEYKYIVDGQWKHDPNQETCPNCFGTLNNVVRANEKEVAILFHWNGGGQKVYLCTDFHGWESNKILMSSGHTQGVDQVQVVMLPPIYGRIPFLPSNYY